MTRSKAKLFTDEIMALYDAKGQLQYGEDLTQLQHMIQSAVLAEEEGYDEEIILAAFLHDIGHFLDVEVERMGNWGVQKHEKIGARYLTQRGFSSNVTTLVAGHVETKRYLCLRDEQYYENLSTASKKTLEYQGGVMSEQEARAFEADPLLNMHIRLRIWDDMGKRADLVFDTRDKYRDMIFRHLMREDR